MIAPDPAIGDRLTYVRVRGMRTLADVTLPLSGLTILIGENGAGKSSLLEALELLTWCARSGSGQIVNELVTTHGGLDEILRHGAPYASFEIRIEGGGPPIDYGFSLQRKGTSTAIGSEYLDLHERPNSPQPLHVLVRDQAQARYFHPPTKQLEGLGVPDGELGLMAFGHVRQPAIDRVIRVLARARVHAPFEVGAAWVARTAGRDRPTRETVKLGRASEVTMLGDNIANAYHTIKEIMPREVWERVRTKLEVGLDIVDVRLPASMDGRMQLCVQFRGDPGTVSAYSLSDGQLAYMVLVALIELGSGQYSLVGFDEPEQHLHPDLLVRAVWLLEELAQGCPVVVATQSDRLLDALTDPAEVAVLCELNERRETVLRRPDKATLDEWLRDYRGLGTLREEGGVPHVFTKDVGVGAER